MSRDDDYDGCGISQLWAFPQDHPFTEACKKHDTAYITGSEAQATKTRKEVDTELFNGMKAAADTSFRTFQAYLFYGIVRLVGGHWWEGKK